MAHGPRRAPGADDDLWLAEHSTQLVDDRGLDLRRRHPPDRASLWPLLQHGRDACPIGRVPAAEIEAAVIDQLRGVFRQPEIVIGTWSAAKAEQDDVTEDEAREALTQFDPLWDELFPAEQGRIVQLLVERVDVHGEGVDIRFRMNGIGALARETARRAA